MRLLRIYSLIFVALVPVLLEAFNVPCYDSNPQVCAFLNRYISELLEWKEQGVSVYRKMQDDKFVVVNGMLENVEAFNDSTSFILNRYDNKAYEAIWLNRSDTLLHVAFPIQYELILGMPQIEIEQHLQEYISQAPLRKEISLNEIPFDSIAPNVYRSTPKQHYKLPNLNNCMYITLDSAGVKQFVCDTTMLDYTISNLFQCGLGKEYNLQMSQSLYGFKQNEFSVTLQQWLNYCAAENLTIYVAIEENNAQWVKVLVVAENKDLAYNHLLSVAVAKELLGGTDGNLAVKINAFIPTHNITNLYEQFIKKEKKDRQWSEN